MQVYARLAISQPKPVNHEDGNLAKGVVTASPERLVTSAILSKRLDAFTYRSQLYFPKCTVPKSKVYKDHMYRPT